MAMKRRQDCATPFSRPSTPWYNLLGGWTNDRQLARGDQHVSCDKAIPAVLHRGSCGFTYHPCLSIG
ncbi:hypothetical protein QLX08_001858 [Tetragonisca angustula]|uniref:Uncharacterized protein n=1 Tax=Tetragonisca angustula TaxID=166442 RepID=A0AAW1AD06_9HYME